MALHKFFEDLNNDVKQKFEHTYNLKYEDQEISLKELDEKHQTLYYICDDEDLLVYYFGVDCLTGEPMTFLLFDELIDRHDVITKLLEKNTEFECIDSTPIAKLDLTSISFEDWQKGVPCKSSYIKGAKFSDLDISVQEFTIQENSNQLDDFVQTLVPLFQLKQKQYPDTSVESFVSNFKTIYNIKHGNKAYIIKAMDKVVNEEVFTFIAYTNDEKECFGPFILITENELLRKKHRCYIVGHQEVIRLGYKLGCKSVDFGLFFDYKESLNIPRTWLKGIMLKDKHLCYELAKINPNFDGICKELARHGKGVVAH